MFELLLAILAEPEAWLRFPLLFSMADPWTRFPEVGPGFEVWDSLRFQRGMDWFAPMTQMTQRAAASSKTEFGGGGNGW